MKTMLFEHCRACVILVALVALMVPLARGTAYLALVGPPPLRFEKAAGSAKIISWTPAALTPPTVAVETNSPLVTSTIPINNVVPPPPSTEPAIAPVPSPTENLSKNSTVQTRTANDLLVVTPEMLVDYFKSSNDATNAANIHVLAPVNFTPPASASIPSSQAIYTSQ